MRELANTLTQLLSLNNVWFWGLLAGTTLLVWVGVRAFLDDSRLRRVLSLVIPLVPVALVALEIALDWTRVRRSFTFNRPAYLALLGLLPVLVAFSLRSLAGLGAVRQTLAIVLRAAVLTLVILALAETQFVKYTERLAVMFLLDYSRSIPPDAEDWMRKYVDQVMQKHKPANDLAGVIYFAKQSRIETPPLKYIELREPEGEYDRDHSDLSAALKMAQAAFPEDTMKRIFLISDGNENRGDALRQAIKAKQNGISIDVLPIRYKYEDEVMVEKLTLPAEVHQGETINLNVIVRGSAPTSGILRIFQKSDNQTIPLAEQEVVLEPGVRSFTVKHKLDEVGAYTFEAKFQPADPKQDRIAANNDAANHTYIRGTASVLLIEGALDEQNPVGHDSLVRALRQENIEVHLRDPERLPDNMNELRPYDAVILANLPREDLSDRQMEMLAENTRTLGAGLIMIGGPRSFGAGGYIDTPIEKAMPVDMQIKSLKVTGKGALVLIMHACEIPQGNYWEKVIAKEAIKTLSYNDEAGCIQSQGSVSWVFRLQQVGDKTRMFSRIDRMTPQDMMEFDSVLTEARNALQKSDAMTKHVILVTDGDPQGPAPALVRSFKDSKITVTTVGVGVHGGMVSLQTNLANIAKQTGGTFYNVRHGKELPKIFQKEARVVSRPLIFEKADGWLPKITYPSDAIAGLTGAELPRIKGLVLTTPKQNELVEVAMVSPQPGPSENPLLAVWQYGLGKSVAFTSDAGQKWTTEWTGWENYRKFWSQVVRWSMRSVDQGNVNLTTHLADGKIKVIAEVLDKDNKFVNFAQIRGNVLDPDMKTHPLELAQTAPGRYEGVYEDAESQGTYNFALEARLPGEKPVTVTKGENVPYPAEYRELESNPDLLRDIALITGGRTVKEEDAMRFDSDDNPFRHDLEPPKALQDLWHLLLFAALPLFLLDIAVRRIALDLSRVRPALAVAWAYARGRQIEAAATDYMTKLRSRKAEVGRQLDQARSARRFEPTPDAPLSGTAVTEGLPGAMAGPTRSAKPVERPGVTPQAPTEQETYTSRLLKAKQKVWEEKKS